MLKAKRFKLLLLLLGSFLFIFYATYFPLPTKSDPIRFYSTHNREDLHLVTLKALKKAKDSIHIHSYSLTDPQVLSLLMQKARSGIDVHITYHEQNTPRLKHLPHLHLHPIKKSGLMHAKWMVIDQRLILLGTANLTASSLMMHDNFIVGLDAPDFANALITPRSYQGAIGHQNLTFFLLPESAGFEHLLAVLNRAQKKVCVALFTLTHPTLVQTLAKLYKRGVSVELILDQLGARGSSKKALETLLEAHLPVRRSQGKQLFHHKWALVDDMTLIIGSANWTKAAFLKNKDFILFLTPLTKKQIKYLKKTIKVIKKDSFKCN